MRGVGIELPFRRAPDLCIAGTACYVSLGIGGGKLVGLLLLYGYQWFWVIRWANLKRELRSLHGIQGLQRCRPSWAVGGVSFSSFPAWYCGLSRGQRQILGVLVDVSLIAFGCRVGLGLGLVICFFFFLAYDTCVPILRGKVADQGLFPFRWPWRCCCRFVSGNLRFHRIVFSIVCSFRICAV